MTKRQLQITTHTIGLVVFAVAFLILDELAGYDAGILAQWVVILVSALISAVVWFGLACFFTRNQIT